MGLVVAVSLARSGRGRRRCYPTASSEIQAHLVQCLAVAFGDRLQIMGAPAATYDPEHRHQQQELLWIANTTAKASVGEGLDKAD